jgi:Pentapeptide repeats (8 copies)
MPRHLGRPRPESWATYKLGSKRKIWLPALGVEWMCEWIAYALSNWALLEALEYLGKFSLLFAVVYYLYESPDRLKQKHYQAWQVINTAQGKGGSGGRIDALQELNKDRVPLVGVNASGAFLMEIHLEKAHLVRADLSKADLRGSHLDGAMLEYANLAGANLRSSSLRGSNLENADLTDADLEASSLADAKLDGADLARADLRNCDLAGVIWKGVADIKLANIVHVKNAPGGFTEWALQHGAVSIEAEDEWLRKTAQ